MQLKRMLFKKMFQQIIFVVNQNIRKNTIVNNHSIISLSGITVRSLNKILFENLDFSVRQGEHWALTGASGSGKTALLDTIAGKLHVSGGTAEYPHFDEAVLAGYKEDPKFTRNNLIAQVSAKYNFHNLSNTGDFYYQQRFNSSDSEDAMTVQEHLETLKYKDGGFWTYQKLVERLNLMPLLDKHLIKLSNGETKRLLIASALIKNPMLLLLDNPLTGLDINTRSDFNQLITEITESGIHIIMATSPKEIPDAITHIAVLGHGKIIASVNKKDYNPDEFSFFKPHQADQKELDALVSTAAQERYETIVDMSDIVIRYEDKTILDHVNWQIRPGERWALLGPNGAGKSTLLSLINGDNPQAYANKIILFDRQRGSGESIWDIKKKIGFVSSELFQYFPTDNSCLQVVESGFYDTLGLFRQSDPTRAEISKRWMKLLEIDDSSSKLFKGVSASVQRLCLLARALVKNPPLLIFDEPCQGLDAHQQEHFKSVVDRICQGTQVTLIYVSHYQHEIPASVKHTLKLEKGHVVSA
jgi:molybdate transport system ATP-binding protein